MHCDISFLLDFCVTSLTINPTLVTVLAIANMCLKDDTFLFPWKSTFGTLRLKKTIFCIDRNLTFDSPNLLNTKKFVQSILCHSSYSYQIHQSIVKKKIFQFNSLWF